MIPLSIEYKPNQQLEDYHILRNKSLLSLIRSETKIELDASLIILGYIKPSHKDYTEINLIGFDYSKSFIFGSSRFKELNLSGANLTGANFQGANFWGTILTNANLTNANFTNANLWGAILRGADLTNADLTGAIMPVGWSLILRKD
jgi:uncharacterized protein YjbI with pentapeptide repeats